MTLKMDFVPRVRIGPFFFGASASDVEALGLVLLDEECDVDYLTYGDEEDSSGVVRIYVEDNKITGAGLYKHFFYNNINLIGLSLDEAEASLGMPPSGSDTQELTDEIQTIYYWDDFCLALWVSDGTVVTAQCDEFLEEECMV